MPPCPRPGQRPFNGHHAPDSALLQATSLHLSSFRTVSFRGYCGCSRKCGRTPRPGANGCGGRGSREAQVRDPPNVQQTLLPVPRIGGSPRLPGSQLPTLSNAPGWLQLPPARRAQEPGSRVWDSLQTHVHSSSVLLRGPSLWGSLWICPFLPVRLPVSVSASPSLSRPGRLSSGTAALPAAHSRAFPQEAEPEGPPRSGCRDLSAGGRLCRPARCGAGCPVGRQGPWGPSAVLLSSVGLKQKLPVPAPAAGYYTQ